MITETHKEQEFLQRIQTLETEVFGDTAENKYGHKLRTARETAKAISENKIPNQHLGNHTPETLEQEIKSLARTKLMYRNAKWWNRFHKLSMSLGNLKSEFGDKYPELVQRMTSIASGATEE